MVCVRHLYGSWVTLWKCIGIEMGCRVGKSLSVVWWCEFDRSLEIWQHFIPPVALIFNNLGPLVVRA